MSCSQLFRWLWVAATLVGLTSSSITIYDSNNTMVNYFENLEYDYDRIPPEGILGFLWPVIPFDACQPVELPPFNSSIGWLAIAAMGRQCNFSVKLKNAMAANFSALILIRSAFTNSSSLLDNGPVNDDDDFIFDHLIPAVVVTPQVGSLLVTQYAYKRETSYLARIDSNILNLGQYVWPFVAIISLLILIIVCFMKIARFVQDRRREMRTRLSSKTLKHLPLHKFKKGEDSYEMCAICLEAYQDGEKLRVLPCQHAYHSKCVDPWLTKNRRVCPVCKRKITARGAMSDSDSEDSDSGGDRGSERTPLLAPPSQPPTGEPSTSWLQQRLRLVLPHSPPPGSASLNSEYGAVGESPHPPLSV